MVGARQLLRWYVIPSEPGADFDEHFLSMPLMQPGVIGERSRSDDKPGGGRQSRTQPGREPNQEERHTCNPCPRTRNRGRLTWGMWELRVTFNLTYRL